MDLQPDYVAARGVLLDAVAPMTTDADLAIHRDWLADEPELCASMVAAWFRRGRR